MGSDADQFGQWSIWPVIPFGEEDGGVAFGPNRVFVGERHNPVYVPLLLRLKETKIEKVAKLQVDLQGAMDMQYSMQQWKAREL